MSLSNLQVLDDTGIDSVFKQKRFDILKLLEGNSTTPYFDTKGIITIGIGFNIDAGYKDTNRKDVMTAMGLSNAQKAAINAAWESPTMAEIKAMPQGTTAQLNAKNTTLLTYLNDTLGVGQSFSMTDSQIKQVFDVLVLEHQNAITSLISTPSIEQVVLTSLHYNSKSSNSLIGPGLKAALALTDPAAARAEAWYQIRYVHKDENQARRYMEAALFGLYNDVNNVTVADFKGDLSHVYGASR